MALKMSWQHNLLHKRKNSPPLGLKNLGNTCYINSVLQCLTYTPPLANFCLRSHHSSFCDSSSSSAAADRKRDCPFCVLEKRIVRSLSIDVPLDDPGKIQNCLKIFAEHFRLGRQEDAHEFLRYVIDACHDTCLRLKKLQQKQQHRKGNEACNGNGGGGGGCGDSVVNDIFGGALQSQVKCLSCGGESNKTDDIMDISLELFQCNSLKEAMQRFFQYELLDGSNKYKCGKCKKLVAARKQMSILKAPNILVIQLKRFEGIHGGKIDRAIAFEEVLVLSSYMCKASQDPFPEYNLFGTIVHSGYSQESGHYYAYIKDAIGSWYCCDDSHVSLSTLQEVLSEKVYILFFSRTNQRTRPTKTAFASNGVKSPNSNGKDGMASQKAGLPLTAVPTKRYGIQPSEKHISSMSKIGKVPSGPRVKFGNSINSDPKRVEANGNGHLDVHKSGSVEKHLNLQESSSTEKRKNEVPSIINRNGANEKRSPDSGSKQVLVLPYQNGESQSTSVSSLRREVRENNGTEKMVTIGRGPDCDRALCNEKDDYPFDTSKSKRKSLEKETCIFLAKDASYQAKLENFREVLAKDASSGLRSCSWYDEVYSFMLARKRLCARDAGDTLTSNIEIKKMLISDAKSTFISQIPESLKEHLVECLRSFSEEKQFLDT